MVERLCAERGESYASLSRLLGRNDAYIQQFLKKGTPRRLPERERRTLARYFSIPESMLGGPEGSDSYAGGSLIPVVRSAAHASAGPGAFVDEGMTRPYFGFDERWLRGLTATPAARLSMVRVEGDSMAPTLGSGDDILVDHDDSGARLRDGIYVVRVDQALLVKRLTLHPLGRRVTVQSDNPAYSDWPDCGVDEIHYVGRVVWAGRRIG